MERVIYSERIPIMEAVDWDLQKDRLSDDLIDNVWDRFTEKYPQQIEMSDKYVMHIWISGEDFIVGIIDLNAEPDGIEEQSYLVTWAIDLDAQSSRDAAQKALAIHRDPESIAVVFEVLDQCGNQIRVDLMEGIPCQTDG